MSAVYTPLFDKIQRHTHRYSTNVSGIHPAIFDKVDVHSYVHTTRACVHIFATRISPTNLRFSFGNCRFRCIIVVLLLTCLAAFALTLLVCLFACRRKKKRPHAPGTPATRRNIAVAIPLAFNKRLQQHMRSTTLGPAPSKGL